MRYGLLPLHHALFTGASLGSIKALTKRNHALLNVADDKGNRPLHFACSRGNLKVINFLLGCNDSSVSVRNTEGKLPIQLLSESEEEKLDRDSPEYVETVMRLLLAHPLTVLGFV